MELFSLVAKLVLDSKEYQSALDDAVSSAGELDDIEAQLGVDTSDFDSGIADAEDTEIDPIEGELTLNSDDFTTGLDEASSKTDIFQTSMGNAFEGIASVIQTAGVAAAIVGVVNAMGEAVDLARSMGDNIDKSSRAMSISTDAYQEWSHVLDINGASITDLNRGLMNMRKLAGGGEATKEFTDAMVELGLAAEDAEGSVTSQFSSTEEMLKAAMKALADFDTSTDKKLAERDRIAQAIFGRGGTKLNAMFDGTSEDIDYLINQAHELGLVMTEEEIANAASYNDAVTNLRATLDGLKTSFVADIIPVLTEVVNSLTQVVSTFNARNQSTPLLETFNEIDKQLSKNVANITGTSEAAQDAIDKLFAMGDASALTADEQLEWKTTAGWLIEQIPQLSEVIDLDTMKINGNKDAIKDNIKEWENLSKQRALSSAVEAKEVAMQEKYSDAIDAEATAMAKREEAKAKYRATIAAVNEILKGEGLDEFYVNKFREEMGGNTELTMDTANLDQMLWNLAAKLNNTPIGGEVGWAKEFKDELKVVRELYNEYSGLQLEADSAEQNYANYSDDLEKARVEFEYWKTALLKMYGATEDAAEDAKSSIDEIGKAADELDGKQATVTVLVEGAESVNRWKGHRKGLWTVPEDDYPALLHRDEMVLTASEARRYRNGEGGDNSDVVASIQGLRNDLKALQLVVNGKTFGRAVVDYGGERVDNYIGSADNRLYSGYGT